MNTPFHLLTGGRLSVRGFSVHRSNSDNGRLIVTAKPAWTEEDIVEAIRLLSEELAWRVWQKPRAQAPDSPPPATDPQEREGGE